MKKYILIITVALLSLSCNGQSNKGKKDNTKEKQESIAEQPKGSWKVDKEFDENGNLIRYDSIYSWSSNNKFNDLSSFDKDSLLKSFESKFFRGFSHFENQGFEDIFSKDSLFSKHFFNDDFFGSDFGKDFMDIDKIRQQMIARQKKFLEKYRSEFIKPQEEN
ncbi:hypothetical protein [Pontimicrobium sp. SW4]|uniref:Lipoprotein n=1 Tax=Pontimicrobium sp. SW4 TaxID=3153519 RepID=A0AAU7BV95_9FLAO